MNKSRHPCPSGKPRLSGAPQARDDVWGTLLTRTRGDRASQGLELDGQRANAGHEPRSSVWPMSAGGTPFLRSVSRAGRHPERGRPGIPRVNVRWTASGRSSPTGRPTMALLRSLFLRSTAPFAFAPLSAATDESAWSAGSNQIDIQVWRVPGRCPSKSTSRVEGVAGDPPRSTGMDSPHASSSARIHG
jgi:hypothetical protein